MDPGWTTRVLGGSYAVAEVPDPDYAVGLQPGEELVSVAGDSHAGLFGPALALARIPAGARYTVQVRRGVERRTITAIMGPGRSGSCSEALAAWTVALLLYVAGAWIFIARSGDSLGRLAGLAFLLSSLTVLSNPFYEFPGWSLSSSVAALMLTSLWRPWQLAVNYHFLSGFPEMAPRSVSGRAVLLLFYAAAALLWVPTNLPLIAQTAGWPPGPWLASLLSLRPDAHPGGIVMAVFETLTGVAIGTVLLQNYLRLRTMDARRRMRWAGLGFAATAVVFVIYAAARAAWMLTGTERFRVLSNWANQVGLPVMGLAVVALVYAVARHRVMGIRVVVRRGLQYLLAKNVLRLIVLLPLLILLFEAVQYPNRSLNDLLLRSSWRFYLALAVTGAISLRFRRSLRIWLDRKFFRDAAEREQLLLQLIEHIKTAESADELSLSVAREVGVALQPDGLHILLTPSTGGTLRIAHSQLPLRAARIRDYLERGGARRLASGQRFAIYVSDPAGPDESPSEYRENLVFPLASPDRRPVGALVLGPKGSDEPYTHRDELQLKAITSEMAMMYEVLRLRVQIEEEQRMRASAWQQLNSGPTQLLHECAECGRCFTNEDRTCSADGKPLSQTLPVERVLDGKYRLERRIGKGGMGVVYEASDTRLGRPVAVKIMVGTLFGNSAAVARFEREARLAALLDQPNIVRMHDFGRLAAGGAYLVMELVRGRSWREHLDAGIPASRAAIWIEQLCGAIAAAHLRGIVHRDLKPENLMIARERENDRVVVLDFGLAKMRTEMSHLDPDVTMVGQILGTRRYMSPEQRMGGQVDWRTDVYSVAVMCTETLTGFGPPRSGASLEWMRGALRRVADGPLLEPALARAMANEPTERMPIASFCEELTPVIRRMTSQPAATTGARDTVTLDGSTL